MPLSGSTETGFCGTVSTITGTPVLASWSCFTSCIPRRRPWSSASMTITSGRCSLIRAGTSVPSDTMSTSRT